MLYAQRDPHRLLCATTGIALGVILVMGLDEPEVGFGCWLGEGPLFPVGLVRIPASETQMLISSAVLSQHP